MRVREHIRQDEAGQEVIRLVESKQNAHRGGERDVEGRECEVELDRCRQVRVLQSAHHSRRDEEDAQRHRRRRPRHAAELLDPEVRDHPNHADDRAAIRPVVAAAHRHRHAERDGADDVDGAENRERDPAERHEVDERHHPGVIEEAGGRPRPQAGEDTREPERHMRGTEVEQRNSSRGESIRRHTRVDRHVQFSHEDTKARRSL
jgi:hypothetical protein